MRPILLNRGGQGRGFEKSLAELNTLRRGGDEIVAPKNAGIPMSPRAEPG